MSRFAIQVALQWAGVAFYVAACAAMAHAVIFDHPRRVRWGMFAAAAGLLPHGAAIVQRWVVSGHGPYMMKVEVLSSNAWVAVAILVAFLWRRPAWASLGLVVLPAAIILVAAGIFSSPEIRELPPTLRSTWLVFHVGFAKLATGSFLMSVGSGVILLLKARGHPAAWLARLPSAEALDAYIVRFVGFGFLFWTMAVVAGAIWANLSWGRYWAWDPIETWSLVAWLAYGTFLHARRFFRLGTTATARWAIACFAIFILTILILPFVMPSLHSAYLQ